MAQWWEFSSPSSVSLQFNSQTPCHTRGLILLLVLYSAWRGFSSGTQVFFSPQKPTFSNSTLILECRGIFEWVLVNSLMLRGYWQITYLHILLHFITKHWSCKHMQKVSTCIPLGWSRSWLWSKITRIMVCQGTDSWIYSRQGFIS